MDHRLLVTRPDAPAPAGERAADAAAGGGPRAFHRRLPGYAPTALTELPELARRLGVGAVLAKVETERMGLPSYKVLGASWATYRAVLAAGAPDPEPWADVEQLRERFAAAPVRRLVAATDGNHGRAVARTARYLGWEARILVPAGTASARIDAIASEGAQVDVVDGSYDDAVRTAALLADAEALVISDTAWEGYRDVPGWVVEGYSTIFAEVDEQVAAAGLPEPTHAVVPVGVGSLAAAAAAHRAHRRAADPLVLVSVEPAGAACVMASVAAGAPVEVPGPHDSAMAGLNCGLASPLALPLVQRAFTGYVAIDDAWAEEATRLLAGLDLAVGESAAAALGGLLALEPEEAGALRLGPGSCVLLVLTEGVTDPANYERILAGAGAAS